MSIKLMARIWEYQFTKAEQSILLAMADHSQDDGSQCFPSVDRVAWKTDYSDRQVQRTMHSLTRRGILTVVRKAGRSRPTEYKINIDKADPKPEFQPKKPSYQIKGDTMSPQIKGDMVSPYSIKGDIAMSPQAREKVTFEALKGDIAMSPEPLTNKYIDHLGAWEQVVTDYCASQPINSPAHKWLLASCITKVADLAGTPLYRLEVPDPAGAEWLDNRAKEWFRRALNVALKHRIALEIVAAPMAELEPTP